MAGWLDGCSWSARCCSSFGAANPALGQVWSAPQEAQLRLIADAATAWTFTNSLFLVAAVLTAAGLWLLPERIGERGLVAARAATVVYLIAATAWLAALVFRLTVTPDAATAFVAAGSLDPTYVVTDRWAVGLFGDFIYLAGGSLMAIGIAELLGGAMPRVAGWFAVGIGIVMVSGYAMFGDMPPFVSYLPTGLLGIVLLPRRGRLDAHRQRVREGPG